SWLPAHGAADGVWLGMASPLAAELAAQAGFAWALIDLEHGAGGEADALRLVHALTPTATAPIVRLPSASSDLATRLLDAGAAGLMAPHIDSAAEAAAFAARLRYPPHGRRGVSAGCRAAGYGAAWPAYRAETDARVCALAQIETAAGVAAADAIAALPGVDVLFIGHSDLAADLGCGDDLAAPALAEAERAVLAACRAHGKRAGMLLKAGMPAAPRRAAGFDLLALGSDLGCLRSGLARLRATP
ncbi:MAG: aldolase/citrate lyase family protein, partial [Planctomycetes bacterium]|nr:aldolase/citrate lyase family protein [Planctomycetota bacterium]